MAGSGYDKSSTQNACRKRVGYRARYVGGDDQVVARVAAWMRFRVRRTDKPVGWQPPWVSDPLHD
jgi:hypothetical protein